MSRSGYDLAAFLRRHENLTVVTGAGVSTASGIPDYRDESGEWKHLRPMQFSEFIGHENARKRYWARSFVGWRRIEEAAPNSAHSALAELESTGRITTLITQNVDGLHDMAGSRNVIDLHGRLDRVRCMSCDTVIPRSRWQERLSELNRDWRASVDAFAPDGDAEINAGHTDRFIVPACSECRGVIKPDVVFFGESVPRKRSERARDAVAGGDALLVVGSSLMVFSGYRFARLAGQMQIPIAIVNRGKTRADDLAELKIGDDCGAILSRANVALRYDTAADVGSHVEPCNSH